MATRKQFWMMFSLMNNICSAHNTLDNLSYGLQDLSPNNGLTMGRSFDEIQQDAIIGAGVIVNMESRIKKFVQKYGLANVQTVLSNFGFTAADLRDEIIGLADEARYIQEHILEAETKADLAVLGQHIAANVDPLVTPLNEWRL